MIFASLPVPLSVSARIADNSSGVKLGKHFIVIGLLSLSSFAVARAHPLDSPETVYIDGVPCNGACQSYMAWSRKTMEQNSSPRLPAAAPAPAASREVSRSKMTSEASPKHVARQSPARQTASVPRKATRDLTAGLEYLIPVPAQDDHPAATKAAGPETKIETKTAAAETQTVAPQAQAAAPTSAGDKTIEQQILAATVLADRVTAASVAAVDANKDDAGKSAPAESAEAKDDTGNQPRSPDRVVLILARADVQSIADLANKDIAIEASQAQFRDQIRTGIVAAGASMVELRDGTSSAIDRLVSGEQPAAILTLASPEAADWFPEIKGFRTFRIPLSPS